MVGDNPIYDGQPRLEPFLTASLWRYPWRSEYHRAYHENFSRIFKESFYLFKYYLTCTVRRLQYREQSSTGDPWQ
jgi:hypothetical protein